MGAFDRKLVPVLHHLDIHTEVIQTVCESLSCPDRRHDVLRVAPCLPDASPAGRVGHDHASYGGTVVADGIQRDATQRRKSNLLVSGVQIAHTPQSIARCKEKYNS